MSFLFTQFVKKNFCCIIVIKCETLNEWKLIFSITSNIIINHVLKQISKKSNTYCLRHGWGALVPRYGNQIDCA
jgi:hypothetical protein